MTEINQPQDIINSSSPKNEEQGDADNTSNTGNNSPSFATVEQVNKAITNRNKQLEKQLAQMQSQLEQLINPNKEEKPESKYQQMQSQMDQLRKERETEKALNADLKLRATVKEQLESLGIKPSFIKALMAQMIDVDKIIGYSEDGSSMIFRDQFGEEDLTKGLKEWGKGAEAQEFKAARDLRGTGDKSKRVSSTSSTPDEATDTLYKFFGITK